MQKWIWLVSRRIQFRSPGLKGDRGSSIALSSGVGCRRNPGPGVAAAVAPTRSLTWELPYATHAVLKSKKQKNQKTKKNKNKQTKKDTCAPIFTAVLFTVIAKTWKQPKCPLTGEWIKKMWYIYIMKYYSAIKKEWNNVICSNMDATRVSPTKWSQ